MIEVLIALLLMMIGVVALMSMQPQGWALSARSDYSGRAAALLHSELGTNETLIMNPCNAVAVGTVTQTVYASGGGVSAGSGDMPFTVQTTIAAAGANAWTVAVRVTWTGNAAGVAETLLVSRQRSHCFPAGCNADCPVT